MKASDYIVEFLINKDIKDIFGYPGGMVTHLMNSLGERSKRIQTHITYHEQSAAIAACGYAQATKKLGVAFATSGPGATNLVTGIANAYFDSIPTMFITGQVNTYESKEGTELRQRGFQETDICAVVSSITKKAYHVRDASYLPELLEEAYGIAMSGRPGPVLIDIPMNIFRANIEAPSIYIKTEKNCNRDEKADYIFEKSLKNALAYSRRPCILVGNGVKIANQTQLIRNILKNTPMPVVSSMLAVDIAQGDIDFDRIYYGFIGAYGKRTANFVVAKADLVICFGTRLDIRQVGSKRNDFAPNAKIIRVDIDDSELANPIRDNEETFLLDMEKALLTIQKVLLERKYHYNEWIDTCQMIKKKIGAVDDSQPNCLINSLSEKVPDEYSIVADVGQNMVWIAQSFKFKNGQNVYLSGGLGAMGYALPASIGVYYATKKPVICFVGDGGLQMCIQELQFLARARIPVKIVVLNNNALGMIRHFQEMYFDSRYYYTVENQGYDAPDFVKIAEAYGILSRRVRGDDDITFADFNMNGPELFEIVLEGDTYVYPKLEFGKPNQDQEPLLDRDLYNKIMEL